MSLFFLLLIASQFNYILSANQYNQYYQYDEYLALSNNLQSSPNYCNERGGDNSTCGPGNWPRADQCHYIKECCKDTLGSNPLIDYLTMQYCFFNNVQPLGVIVLAIFVFYAFLILGNVADELGSINTNIKSEIYIIYLYDHTYTK